MQEIAKKSFECADSYPLIPHSAIQIATLFLLTFRAQIYRFPYSGNATRYWRLNNPPEPCKAKSMFVGVDILFFLFCKRCDYVLGEIS